MPAPLEPIRPFKCTYEDCSMSFDGEEQMKSHKRYSDEHDYCHKCDEDFADYDGYALHKITRPKEHHKACRVCGDEFKSTSGLKRHIELSHKIDQKLTCIGCHKSYYRATLFIEHLEFGHCDAISPVQFQGHIVHKHLVTQLLNSKPIRDRLQQKQAKYDATLDYEEEGGVDLGDEVFDDEDIDDVQFKAIEPQCAQDPSLSLVNEGPYPPLPSQLKSAQVNVSGLATAVDGISLAEESDSITVINSPSKSPISAPYPASSIYESSVYSASTRGDSTVSSTPRQAKAWGSRDGRSTSNVLFPDSKPTPVLNEFSIAAYDQRVEKEHGANVFRARFWDPTSKDWNPDRFYDSNMNKYYCPFVCEQTFGCVTDLNKHINNDHRVVRVKCPMCLKYFKSATALMAHCESRGAKCEVSKADDFGIFLDRFSGGFLGVEEKVRPDHLSNPTVIVTNQETGKLETYKPPVATHLQYRVTTPPDWEEPAKIAKAIGGLPDRMV